MLLFADNLKMSSFGHAFRISPTDSEIYRYFEFVNYKYLTYVECQPL